MGISRGDAATSLIVCALVGQRQVEPTDDALSQGWVEMRNLNPGVLRVRESRGDPMTWDAGRAEPLSWEDAGPLVVEKGDASF
jgi:hypothetical protein